MNQSPIVQKIKKAANDQLDKHAAEIDAQTQETKEIHLTIKLRDGKPWRVLYSSTKETDLT